MNAVIPQVNELLADPLLHARLASDPVGYVGYDLPLDLTSMSDRAFVHLPWDTSQQTPVADKWLESSFPGWARSILQSWSEGHFDLFSHVVFSRGDDATQRMYYYLCELRRKGVLAGPEPLILDIAKISRESSIQHCQSALRRLLATLEISEDMLDSGIDQANALRQIYSNLEEARSCSGALIENIARAALFGNLLPVLQDTVLPESKGFRRLVLAGSVPPDDRLYRMAETLGWTVSGELHARQLWRHGGPIAERGEHGLAVIARRMNDGGLGPRAFIPRSENLQREMVRAEAEAVVIWLTEEDEAFAWHVADQISILENSGVPHLLMTRRRWNGEDGADMALKEFLEGLSA